MTEEEENIEIELVERVYEIYLFMHPEQPVIFLHDLAFWALSNSAVTNDEHTALMNMPDAPCE